MNRCNLLPIIAAISFAAAFAAPASAAPAAAFNPSAPAGGKTLVVSCDPGSRPSQGDVARLLDTNNASEVYAGRERLMAQVRSACQKSGIRQVALVVPGPAPAKAGSAALAQR